jgi:hypothetical protein
VSLKDEAAVVAAIEELGLLFVSDPKRKNAVEVLTGEFPRGSWWTHPEANQIYGILERVEDHPDVLSAKLLAGKVTLIHRALWPALLAVVTAREAWQTDDLLPGSVQWLAALDEARAAGAEVAQPSRTVVKEIEARLLARSESVHTSDGSHRTRIEDWAAWATRAGVALPPTMSPADGQRALEAAAERLGPPPPALPWR